MHRCTVYLLAGVMAAACGCAKKDDGNLPARVKASVHVTYKAAPVEGANVTLMPAQGGGKPAFGITDAQGIAALSTFGQEDGAIPGEYQVSVQKTKVEGNQAPVDPANPGAMPADPSKYQSKTVDLLPTKYASPLSSGLKATVAPDGNNDFSFELTD